MVGLAIVAFVSGTLVSLSMSRLLVSRLERVGERLGMTEALLGVVAALAADAPEITASITALTHHQQAVGAGVVIGSNVFNLAALLGLGAVVAGRIVLHRKVVLFGGAVALYVSLICLLAVVRVVTPIVALVLVLVVLLSYFGILGARRSVVTRIGLPRQWSTWLNEAIVEEEAELEEAIRPRRGTVSDAVVAFGALLIVVTASVAMEHGASSLGLRYHVAEIVVGGLVLAAVTSLPNAVAAVYLARKGRGAAALSTALNSNAINVAAGFLIPAAVIGLAKPTASGVLIAGWYVGLTVLTLILAYSGRGLRRSSGWLIITVYVLFVVDLLIAT